MCSYDSDFIIKYRDSIISQEDREKFELHLLECETCRRKVALDEKFIGFLKSENPNITNLTTQIMTNIDLNKYHSGKGKFMSKLIKWKSIAVKIAAISVICIGGISLTRISPVSEGLKNISLNIIDKQSRIDGSISAGNETDIILASTPKPSLPVITSNGILPDYVDLDKLPENYTVEDAKKDGCVVFEGLFLTSGETEWKNFLKMTENGQSAKIRIANCTEEHFDLTDLLFDGKNYYCIGKDVLSGQYNGEATQYKYLNHYSSETYDYYVLTDMKDIALEELSKLLGIVNCNYIYTNHHLMPNVDIKGIWPDYVSCHELPKDYSIEDAKKDGCVVIENFSLTSGETEWINFLELTKKSLPATARIATFYQDNNVSELTIRDLLFDGSTYYVIEKDRISEQYKYLKHYPSKTDEKYILCDIKDISWNEIMKSLMSSDFRKHIRYKYIFSINFE